MPLLNSVILETMTHVIYPISEQLSERLLDTLRIRNIFDNNIYYNADDVSVSKTSDSKHRAKLESDKCLIGVDYSLNPQDARWSMTNFSHTSAHGISKIYQAENQPIFFDKRADILLLEQIVPCSITLTFDLQFKSKEHAYLAFDAIINRFGNSSIIEHDDIVYTIPFPHQMLLALNRLYKMREFDDPLTFVEYLKAGSRKSISYEKNRYGTDTEIVILKNQFGILSEVTLGVNKPEAVMRNKLPAYFSVPFTYYLQFSRTNMLGLYFPSVIDNKLVTVDNIPNPGRVHPSLDDVIGVDIPAQAYIYARYVDVYPHTIVRFPYWDDWVIPKGANMKGNYKPFFVGALTLDIDIDAGITSSTIDLINDFPDEFKCHQVIIDALSIQGEAAFKFDGLINISIYANDTRIDESLLSIDENLVITIDSTIKHRRYHLVLSELTDIRYLNPRYVPILIKFSDFFALTVVKNLDRLVEMGELEISRGMVLAGKFSAIEAPGVPKGYIGLPDGATVDSDLTPENYGKEYNDLTGYESYPYKNIYTKKGQVILAEKGGSYGFISPWRIGKYVIESRRQSDSN